VLHIQGTPIPSTKPAISVPVDILKTYVGRYRQDNGLMVTIGLDGDQLTLQVDGRQKLSLAPMTPQHFNLPAGTGTITFAMANGAATYEVRRPNQDVIRGTRQ
jgi:hypothetical protein